MQHRIMRMSLAILVPLAAFLAILAIGLHVDGRAAGLDAAQPDQALDGQPDIVAARLISIPYGFDDVLPLGPDGQSVQVGGHGECPDGGVTFYIRATVTQNGRQIRAMGVASGDCGVSGWSAVATTPGSQTLIPGPAVACGHVIIFGTPNGALVGDWCKDVTLQ
jgi:hypothetical protein